MAVNVVFEPGCVIPHVKTVVVGLYADTTSAAGNENPSRLTAMIEFTDSKSRNRYNFIRIERFDEEYLHLRLMPDTRGFQSKGKNGCAKLLDYNHSDDVVTGTRMQKFLGFDNIESFFNENTVRISAASGEVDDELHLFIAIDKTRNTMEYRYPVDETVLPNVASPAHTSPAPEVSTPPVILGNAVAIPGALPADKQLWLAEMAMKNGRNWEVV